MARFSSLAAARADKLMYIEKYLSYRRRCVCLRFDPTEAIRMFQVRDQWTRFAQISDLDIQCHAQPDPPIDVPGVVARVLSLWVLQPCPTANPINTYNRMR